MSLYSAAERSSIVGAATTPQMSLYSPAGSRLIVKEVHVFNTTATALSVALVALTTAGTQGASIDEVEHELEGPPPLGTAFQGHTVDPTITVGEYARASLAAAIGGGVVWIFNRGIIVPAGVANGVGVTTPDGTGQICDITFIWEE